MSGGYPRLIVVGLALAAFAVLAVAPSVYMVSASIGAGVASLPSAHPFEARQIVLAWNSVRLAVGAALLATMIGAPLGLLLARVDLRAKWLLRLLLTIPLIVPPYVLALAWMSLGGPTGLAMRALAADPLSDWTYSLSGAVLVLGFAYFPLLMLATEAAGRGVSARQEEAAVLAAGPLRTLAQITLPAIAPTIAAAGLIAFVLALSDFGVSSLLRVRVYASEVFTAFAALYDFGRAALLTLPLTGAALLVGAAIAGPLGRHLFVSRRVSTVGRRITLGRWHTVAACAAWGLVVVAVVLPVVSLAVDASQAPSIGTIVRGSGAAIVTSLWVAAACASFAVAIGVWLGYWRARMASRWASWSLDAILVALFAVPSTVVGIGLIRLWNQPGVRGLVYSSAAMLVLAPLARFLPMVVLMLAAAASRIPRSTEEAAAVAGAGWLRTMRRIVVPQMALALATSWVILFILAFGELGATVLVAPPGESTLSIRIYTLIANAPPSHVATLALLQVAILVAPLAVLALWLRLRRGRTA